MTILLTGFNAFGKVTDNPSQQLVRHIAACGRFPQVVTEVLLTEYAASALRIQTLLLEYRPRAVLCLGVAQMRREIHLERVALNLDDATLPDNAGDLATGRPIDPDGPAAYWSTFPLEAMQQQVAGRGIPVAISNHAGTFVCNHVFYTARHTLQQHGLTTPCGFIHVPAVRDPADPNSIGLSFEQMTEAIEVCLSYLTQYTGVS
jgi:pyroglutamyl-peptidase